MLGLHCRAFRFWSRKTTTAVLVYSSALDYLVASAVCWQPFIDDIALRRVRDPTFDDLAGFSGFIRHGDWIVAPAAVEVIAAWSILGHHTIRRTMELELATHPGECSEDYMEWFERHGHPRMIRPGLHMLPLLRIVMRHLLLKIRMLLLLLLLLLHQL